MTQHPAPLLRAPARQGGCGVRERERRRRHQTTGDASNNNNNNTGIDGEEENGTTNESPPDTGSDEDDSDQCTASTMATRRDGQGDEDDRPATYAQGRGMTQHPPSHCLWGGLQVLAADNEG